MSVENPDARRTAYFHELAVSARPELKIHQAAGLWGEKDQEMIGEMSQNTVP